ncbi:hypothetical protein JP0099_03590 [Helicobacter pylori]|uniref:DUF874 family protein n=1 Tax=Helicobacter pylori TaxID=210 RepID=UPI001AA6C12B|nr:DUF874 family protein [Helicobacter pylori]GHR48883.1 hypothetical protein JP0099_03590 [Helicobacter pylori]
MELVKTGKTNKVGKNTEMAHTKTNKETHFKQVSVITNRLRSIGGIFTKIAKKVRELVKKHPKKSNAALVVLTHIACKRAKELDDKVQDKSKQAEKENKINWWKYSGLTIATSLLLAACNVGDIDKQIELEQEKKEAENARDRANKSGIELEQEQQKTEQEKQKTEQEKQKTEQEKQKTEQEKQKTEQEKQKTSNIETNNQIKVEQEQQKTEQEKQKTEQEQQKTSNIETNNQIKVEQEQQKTEQEKQKTEQEKQKTNNTQKDLVKKAEQNCQENHSQFFIKKLGIKGGIGGIAIEVEAECKTPKPTKTNQTPIQPKHLPNSKQPHSQRGSKTQELIAYLQKELESLPYSQKAIAKQVDFYKPSSIAYLELDPRDFKVTEEWQNENLKIRSKAQAKMLEMRKTQAHLSPFQSFSILQNIVADINKEIKVVANTEKKAEKVGYGYSKRM